MSLAVDGLVKRFGRRGPPVLDGVTFDVPTGSLTCLLGPSGVGKSTVLGIIAGLEVADAGQVRVAGRPIDVLPAHRRPVTLLMQQPQLFPHLTVAENIAFGLRVRGVDRAARQLRALELMTLVGIDALAGQSTRQLSGGEQQRVALARALAVAPAVLLADEPFASLDTTLRRELQDLVVELHRNLDTTIVLVTHDLDEALALGDQLVLLEQGRVIDAGTPRALYERPATLDSAQLLAFANELTGILERGRLHVGRTSLAVTAANSRGPLQGPRRSTWVIRPERVRLGRAGEPNTVTGTTTALRFQGPAVEARIDTVGVTVVAHLGPSSAPALGETVSVALPEEHLIEVLPPAFPRPRTGRRRDEPEWGAAPRGLPSP